MRPLSTARMSREAMCDISKSRRCMTSSSAVEPLWLRNFHGAAHEHVRTRRAQIFGNALAFAHVGGR